MRACTNTTYSSIQEPYSEFDQSLRLNIRSNTLATPSHSLPIRQQQQGTATQLHFSKKKQSQHLGLQTAQLKKKSTFMPLDLFRVPLLQAIDL